MALTKPSTPARVSSDSFLILPLLLSLDLFLLLVLLFAYLRPVAYCPAEEPGRSEVECVRLWWVVYLLSL